MLLFSIITNLHSQIRKSTSKMNKQTFFAIALLSSMLTITSYSDACTNFIITKSASGGCGNIITYAADSHQLYGFLLHLPAADHPDGSIRDIYDWDSGKYMGNIPEAPHTYNVVGNINEHQLCIAETTYGGLDSLQSQPNAIIDYGSLIYITLQRCATAREAIKTMAELTDAYGYASEGESFSIADKNEAWIMEVIGRGKYGKGMVWVARRIPDGCISAHANQARITKFNYQSTNKWDNPKADTFNSKDVIQFAKDNGFYQGDEKDFSFSDVYNPVDFEGARFCDLRVWAFFNAASPKFFAKNTQYWHYACGNVERKKSYNGGCQTKENFPTLRLPLWIKPEKYVSIHSAINEMRNHLEGTELDMSLDAGAGPFECPYRMRPLTWKSGGKTYLNERATATQQTGWVFAAQMRNWMPNHSGGIIWFATDDAANTVFAPFYCCITRVPEEYAEHNGSLTKWSDNSSFWINNLISNFAYSRYNVIHPEIERIQQQQELRFLQMTEDIDAEVADMDSEAAIAKLTEFCCKTASKLVADRRKLFQNLFMKYLDGNTKPTDANFRFKKEEGTQVPQVQFPGYGEKWQDDVARKTGKKLEVEEKKH